jgi:hypothetical protein
MPTHEEPAPAPTLPAWAVPTSEQQPEAVRAPAVPASDAPAPAAHPDLSSMSIAEIARLADAGSI